MELWTRLMATRRTDNSLPFVLWTIVAIAAAASVGFFSPNIVSLLENDAAEESARQTEATALPSVPAAVTFTPAPPTVTPTFTNTPVPPTPTVTSTVTPTPTPRATATPIKTHVVQPDEALWEIAERYGVDVEDLIELNDIEDPDHLVPGEELKLPPQ